MTFLNKLIAVKLDGSEIYCTILPVINIKLSISSEVTVMSPNASMSNSADDELDVKPDNTLLLSYI